ncbi:MAG: hypothetical protein ACRDHY_16865 [Anaerolineales bacterium]
MRLGEVQPAFAPGPPFSSPRVDERRGGRGVFTPCKGESHAAAGWSLGTEWQIGSASASAGQQHGNPDPATDHTPTADNGVAGAVIGGNVTNQIHNDFFLTSPSIDLSSAAGTVTLELWRWLNSDIAPFMENRIDVFDGSAWQNLYLTGGVPAVTDSAWTQMVFDVTAYAGPGFRLRIGHRTDRSGPFLSFIVSGWNVDDVKISTAPEPGGSLLLLLGLGGLAAFGRPRGQHGLRCAR